MPFDKLNSFTFNHSEQQDDLYKDMSASEIKGAFDSRGVELKNTLNKLIDDLASTQGASNIGVKLVANSPTDLQGHLDWLRVQINAASMGLIPDGSITASKLSFSPATAQELNNFINTFNQFTANNTNRINDVSKQVKIVKNVTIVAIDWGYNPTTELFEYFIYNSNITENTVVDINIHLNDLDKASGIRGAVESFNGHVKLYADIKPTENIICDMKIAREVS